MAYDFTPAEFKQVWEAFHTHADPETHTLSVADLHTVLVASLLVDNVEEEDITWFIRDVNAVDTGKLSVIKLVKGVGDLIDHKGPRKKRPNIGRRFTWREIADLFKLFLSIDDDKSGEISFSELYKALRYINPRAKVNDALSMFAMLDIDKSHAIDFPEFVRGISLGGAEVGTVPTDAGITNSVKRGRPMTKSSQRPAESSSPPPTYLETQEVFRNVEGDSYARETSSPHFPKRMPTSFPSSRTTTSHPLDSLGPAATKASPPPSRASPPQSGSRLYNNWAQKNAKPAAVLDQRVPVAIVHTKPSFFPSSEKSSPSPHLAPLPPPSSSSSSSPSSSFKSSSPSKRDRLPHIDNVK